MERALFICGLLLAAGVASGDGQAVPAGPPAGPTVEQRAEAARAAGRLDEAAALYRKALAARPGWADGLWALGTIAYEQDRFGECRDVFSRLARAQPKMAAAWALRGLCEFGLGAYAPARRTSRRPSPWGCRPATPCATRRSSTRLSS